MGSAGENQAKSLSPGSRTYLASNTFKKHYEWWHWHSRTDMRTRKEKKTERDHSDTFTVIL